MGRLACESRTTMLWTTPKWAVEPQFVRLLTPAVTTSELMNLMGRLARKSRTTTLWTTPKWAVEPQFARLLTPAVTKSELMNLMGRLARESRTTMLWTTPKWAVEPIFFSRGFSVCVSLTGSSQSQSPEYGAILDNEVINP